MKRKQWKHGQGMVEYILITALTALAALAVFRAFREDVAEAYHKAGQLLIKSVDENPAPQPGAGGE